MSITLTDHQWDAVKSAKTWYNNVDKNRHLLEDGSVGIDDGQSFVFTGFAGSGKSTCVSSMIDELGLAEDEVMFMAPTGKAALVLTQKLRADGWNTAATTIHKAIYMPKSAKADAIKGEIDRIWKHIEFTESNGEVGAISPDQRIRDMSPHELQVKAERLRHELANAMDADSPSFTLKDREEIPPEVKLVVVDESSMVGSMVANDLATYGLPMMAIGDPGQLPPVQDVWGFNMGNPDVMLTEIHRQAADNPIIRLATMARNGKYIKTGDYGDGVRVVEKRDDDVTLDMSREAMVLVGTHKKRWAITKRIRNTLGYTETGPMKDEPLMICKNSSKTPALVNGSIVRCDTDHGDLVKGVAEFSLTFTDEIGNTGQHMVRANQGIFEEHMYRKRGAYSAPTTAAFRSKRSSEQLDFAHAITVHKSQGSEWDDVVIHDESAVFRDMASRWLYTGITRASKELTIVV